MAKRFINNSSLMSEFQKDLALFLIQSGKIKSKKDMCRYGICPLILCNNICDK